MPNIVIDFSFLLNFWQELSGGGPFTAMWVLFKSGGWIVILFALYYVAKYYYFYYIRGRWIGTVKYVLLSIDIPKNNEQSPKAVESIFAHFYGMKSSIDAKEKYIIGKFQTPFSLEIVSIGGKIQFFIRVPLKYKDLVESAIYSQYPDVDILEAPDYVDKFPTKFPDPKNEIFGCDFELERDWIYPIRTYPFFEHGLTGEFKDPMSLVLETMSNVAESEILAIQIICVPGSLDWHKEGQKKLDKILGKSVEEKKGIIDYFLGFLGELVNYAVSPSGDGKDNKKTEDAFRMLNLSPGQRKIVEDVELKLSKVGFPSKVRYIHMAPHEIFKNRYSHVKGFLKQFAALNSNDFGSVGSTMPKKNFFYHRMARAGKQALLVQGFSHRDPSIGGPMYVLSVEELATLWHFPALEVKAPQVKKTESKRAEPPRTLPVR